MLKFYKYILLVIFVFFTNSLSVYTQKWIDDYASDKLHDKIVYDIATINDSIWILTNKNVILINNNNNIFNYYLNVNSFGNIAYFLISKDSINNYNKIISKDNILWLFDSRNIGYLKIYNDSVFNFYFDKNIHSDLGTIKYFAVDNHNNLWIAYPFRNIVNSKYSNYIYKLENNYFMKINIALENENFLRISDMFSYSNIMFFIYNSYNNKDSSLVIVTKEQQIINKINFSSSVKFESHYIDSNYIYLMDSRGILYYFNLSGIYLESYDSKIDMSSQSSRCFLINKDKIFYPNNNGLTISNISTFSKIDLIPNNFKENCFWGFDKIYKINIDEFWIVYGGVVKLNCEDSRYGFSVLKLE